MTAKELIEHLKHAAQDEDVLLCVQDEDDRGVREVYVYEVAAVRYAVEMDHEGTTHTTYLVAGDELVD